MEEELKKIKWDIVGLSEVRRAGEDWIKLNSGNVLIHKGGIDGTTGGVGFIIKKNMTSLIKSYRSISDRVAYIIVKISANLKLKIIQVYAPTSKHSEEAVEMFYDQMETAMQRDSTHWNIVMGDFNAKLGKRQENDEEYVGKFGLGYRNERGDTMLNFMNQHKLYAMNSFFDKRPERKWTWISPNGKVKNEIDYILTDKKISIQDVTVLNSFNTGSDHRFVRAALTINKQLERRRIMKNPIKNLTEEEIRERKEIYEEIINKNLTDIAIDDDNETMDEVNKKITTAISASIKELKKLIPSKKRGNTINEETQTLMKTRRQLANENKRSTEEFVKINKEIRKCMREHRRQMQELRINEVIEKNKGLKCLRHKLGKKETYALRNKEGIVIHNRDEILTIVEEFYTDLYESKTKPERENDNKTTEKIQNVGSEEQPDITMEEVQATIKDMKTNKATGDDDISIDMIREGGENLLSKITKLLNICLKEAEIPKAWKNANVILLYKKGENTKLDNYRPISLLSHIYKLLTKIINNRLVRKLDEYQSQEQAGFRKNYSTRDHLLTMKIIIEKSNEYGFPLHLAFIDYRKAFDSIEHWAIYNSLANSRIDHRYIQLIKQLNEEATATYILHEKSKPVPIKRGVRQGDTLSPKLFTLALEDIFKKMNWTEKGINVNGERLTNLRYADDIVLISQSREELEEMITDLNRESQKVGLTMNLDKTKTMYPGPEIQINVEGTQIERVTEYIYLGQRIELGRSSEKQEIKRRIRAGWAAFGKLSFILKNNKIAQHLKTKVFDQCILPSMTYGAENWATTKENIESIRVAQRAMERAMLNITRKDKVRNERIRNITKVTDIGVKIAQLKWSYAGHVARSSTNRWNRKIVDWRPYEHKRGRGRPPMRWYDDFKKTAGLNWIQIAQDRDRWKTLGKAYIQKWI